MPYVITAKSDDSDEVQFLCGGEWADYWGAYRSAKQFDSFEGAEKRIQQSDFQRPNTMSNGTIYPPSLIQTGANINNLRPSGAVLISIVQPEVVLHPTKYSQVFTGEIDTKTREDKIAAMRAVLEANGISDADLEMLRSDR